MDDEFGARSASLVADMVLAPFGRTAAEALEDGIPPRDIWMALCEENDVPAERRHGAGRREPKQR